VLNSRWIAHAALASAVAVSTCADRDVPAATPSALLHRDSVPLGAPVDITLRFRTARGASLAGNHRVLLRFLFDDGTVMASYDHDPPTPADMWQPDTPVTYTRRIFVPEIPYVGDVPVVVGLASPTGKRVRLSGKDVGDRMYEVATFKLHAQRHLLVHADGWHRLEGPAGEGGYRWTHAGATMTFRNPRKDAVLHLRLSAQSDVFPAPQQASILIGSRTVHRFPVAAAQTDYQLPLSAADFGVDDEAILTIKVDRTFVPAAVQKGRDHRELGLRVHNIFLETSFR
jgi:hypothetical protein